MLQNNDVNGLRQFIKSYVSDIDQMCIYYSMEYINMMEYICIFYNRKGLVQVMIDNNTNINTMFLLHRLCFPNEEVVVQNEKLINKFKIDVFETLLSNNIDVNIVNNCNITALHLASEYGYTKYVSLLMKYGADMSIISVYGYSALHLASQKDYDDIVSLIIEWIS